MLRKLLLKRADKYDELVTTYHSIEAVIAYLDGQPHCQRIGNEQGDIKEWDDLVLHDLNGKTVHCQVKRQLNDFCDKKADSRLLTSGKKQGSEAPLSALDKAFESLATVFSAGGSNVEDKTFYLVVPYPQISVKKGLTLVHLKDVCTEWKKAGARLEDFKTASSHTKSVKDWLKTWCNFESDEAIFKCIRCLEVHNPGIESDINDLCNTKLSYWYQDPDKVRDLITSFISKNASSQQSLTPRIVANYICQYIKTERPSWVKYNKQGSCNWTISGTLSGHSHEVEPPGSVVTKLWDDSVDRTFELQLNQSLPGGQPSPLELTLMRLALHSPTSVVLRHNDASAWKSNLSNAIHHTLGNTKNDLNNIKVLSFDKKTFNSDHRLLSKNQDVRNEKTLLTESMNEITWSKVHEAVVELIAAIPAGKIQDIMEDTWSRWDSDISSEPELKGEVIADMMHALVEGNTDIGLLRSGPNTVTLLSEAFELLLYIAIGLEAESMSWSEFCSEFSVRTIALAFWSGPNPHLKKTRKFFIGDKQEERIEFLGKETSKILVLPQTSASPSEIWGCSLASDRNDGDLIANARTPNSVLTRSMAFNNAIDSNDVATLKEYVHSSIAQRHDKRSQHINSLTKGETK